MRSVTNSQSYLQEVAFQNLNDGVFMFDKERKIVVFNHACEQIVGFSKDEILRKRSICLDVFKCHSPDETCLSSCPGLELINGKRSKVSREYLIKTKDGKEKWVTTNYSIIRNKKGEIEYVVGVIRDITEMKLFTDELIKSKTLSILGQFSSELVHEIKNPLNSITIQMSLLEREIKKKEFNHEKELSSVVRVVREEINRLSRLTKDCQEFSKTGHLKRKYSDVCEIIQELHDLIIPHAVLNGINIHISMLRKRLQILIDRDRLKQALLNILINAIEAMPGGGDLYLRVSKIDRYIKISIKNTGSAIPKELKSKVFDLFYTTKGGGTGVGLAITQNIVQAHGGNIRFKNLSGGVEFVIELPID
ncbi:MAG: ATP-binding protein [Candidatus Scalindua sp.]|nr:ATP-binding protein [Candidatus Scalindua sp.]